ncbi:putative zinc-binding oxidoreductase ToxD [Gaertneriomyces semiglobifer]|nr:putative zinc-binding oxidoreductase ToxD [Gaertneriomyces semiglobifer]
MGLPSVQKSVIVRGKGDAHVATNVPIPRLRDDYLLIRTTCVALNPTDWKHIDYLPTVGARVGCDYSGIVEEVGPGARVKYEKGQKVCGLAHGVNSGEKEDGAFGEYIVGKTGLTCKVPDNVSMEDAATLGVGVTTVGQSLYQSLGLPLPGKQGEKGTILIYGGSSATGTLAIQFAKLSGWKVVTTCSKHNFDLVKSLGADAVFDYNDSNATKDIKAYTNDSLTHVFDTISLDPTAKFCADCIGSKGGIYSSLLPISSFPRADVKNNSTLAYTASGEGFNKFGQDFPPNKGDYDFATEFWELTGRLLKEGKVKVHPPKVGKDGLKGVLEGLNEMRQGKVSGVKLVYRVAETPKDV